MFSIKELSGWQFNALDNSWITNNKDVFRPADHQMIPGDEKKVLAIAADLCKDSDPCPKKESLSYKQIVEGHLYCNKTGKEYKERLVIKYVGVPGAAGCKFDEVEFVEVDLQYNKSGLINNRIPADVVKKIKVKSFLDWAKKDLTAAGEVIGF